MTKVETLRILSCIWIWIGAPCVAAILSDVVYRTHLIGFLAYWMGLIAALAVGGVITWRFFDTSSRERALWLAIYLFASLLASVVVSFLVAAAHGDAL